MSRKKNVNSTVSSMYLGLDKDVYAWCSGSPGLAVQSNVKHPTSMLSLRMIHELVLEIIKGDQLAFVLQDNAGVALIVPTDIGNTLEHINDFLAAGDPRVIHDEYVELFYASWRDVCSGDAPWLTGTTVWFDGLHTKQRVMNNLVRTIRSHGRSKSFVSKVRIRQERSDRNYRQAKNYVAKLFREGELLVLKIDIGYAAGSYPWPDRESMLALSEDRKRLVSDMSKRYGPFKSLVGYISTLDFGFTKGDYFHLILFFADSVRISPDDLLVQVGSHWCGIVARRHVRPAVYYDCRRARNIHRTRGIGYVRADDKQARAYLMDGIKYVLLVRNFFRAWSQSNYDTFSTGRVSSGKPKTRKKSLALLPVEGDGFA